jgi:FkbM family methyltransferase
MVSDFFSKVRILVRSWKILKNWYLYPLVYFKLTKKDYVIFETRSGLKIKIRVNSTDLMALTHVWMIQEYSGDDFPISNDDVIIDVGAHIGLFALFASQFCKNGKIFCYEPIKENYKILIENIEMNQIQNIFPNNLAVTKETSRVKIFLNDDQSGHSMFIQNKNFVEVDSKSLSDIFIDNGIKECDFLKLDCEGAEYEIVESLSADLFTKINKTAIEYHMVDTKPELLKQLINKLKQFSFSVHTRPLFVDIGFLFAKK